MFVSSKESQTKANQVKVGVKYSKAIPAVGEHALGQPSCKNEEHRSFHYFRAWCPPQVFHLLSVACLNTFLLCWHWVFFFQMLKMQKTGTLFFLALPPFHSPPCWQGGEFIGWCHLCVHKPVSSLPSECLSWSHGLGR